MAATFYEAKLEEILDAVGDILARALEDGTDAHDYINELVSLYKREYDDRLEDWRN